jgi:hypothetical protein
VKGGATVKLEDIKNSAQLTQLIRKLPDSPAVAAFTADLRYAEEGLAKARVVLKDSEAIVQQCLEEACKRLQRGWSAGEINEALKAVQS